MRILNWLPLGGHGTSHVLMIGRSMDPTGSVDR